MARRAGNAPLDHRWIGAGAELDLVVIGLQDDGGEIAKQIAHRGRGPAEIIRHADAGALEGSHHHR